MVDLRRLYYALAVVRTGNFTAAAERLGITQPALSRSIQSLEAEYGVQLFQRGRGGARLTPLGRHFLGIAENIVKRAEFGEEQLRFALSNKGKPSSFGIGPITASICLPYILGQVTREFESVRVKVGNIPELQRWLHDGEIDFYISGMPKGQNIWESQNKHLRITRVPFSGMGLLVRPEHPLLTGEASMDDLLDFPMASGTFWRDVCSPARLSSYAIQCPSFEIDDYYTLSNLARCSDFLILATSVLEAARPDLGLKLLPLHIDVEDFEWGVVTSEREPMSDNSENISKLLLETICKFL